jgi:hypothetical protein
MGALLIALAGFALGVYLWTQQEPLDDLTLAHVSIGTIMVGFMLLQALAIVARPKPQSKYRCMPSRASCSSV